MNAVTRKDAMPLPRIDDMIDSLAKAKFFTKLDFTSGYYQVKLTDASQEKTAFVTPDGHYEWRVMGMGLTNAPATFQRLMYKVLGGLLWTNSMAYLDDIVIFSPDFETHLKDLAEVFEKIKAANLKIKPPKCSFAKTGIGYLGFVISEKGVECDPANTDKVASFHEPRCRKEVRSFLGLTSYYRKFIRNYAFIAKPLYELTKEDTDFRWGEREQHSFERLQAALVSPPILAFPDFEKQFIVTTDASGYGIGAVLKQLDADGKERVIAYASRVLTDVEQRYWITEKELLALKYATQVFRPYLHGVKFKVITDHRSLTSIKTMRNGNGRLQRFCMHLLDFDFDVEYKEGKKNTDADTMSRYGYERLDMESDFNIDHLPANSDIGVVKENAGASGRSDIIQRSDRQQQKADRFKLQKVPSAIENIDAGVAADVDDNNSEGAKDIEGRLKAKSLCIMRQNKTSVQQPAEELTPRRKIIEWPSDAKIVNIGIEGNLSLNIDNRGNTENPIVVEAEGNSDLHAGVRGNIENPLTKESEGNLSLDTDYRGNIEDPIMKQSGGNLNLDIDNRGNNENPITPNAKSAGVTPAQMGIPAFVSRNNADNAECRNDARYYY